MDLFDAEVQEFGQKLDFGFGDPYHALLGSRTAVSTAGTLEVESCPVPRRLLVCVQLGASGLSSIQFQSVILRILSASIVVSV